MSDSKTEQFQYQADIARLLHLVTHSLYSEREVFLRELIANAADACDKLRLAAQQEAGLAKQAQNLAVRLIPDRAQRLLIISDNGIGMNQQELIDNLGTLARSGTAKFLEALQNKKDSQLIGQFGVGFYSAFMVADKVTVLTRKAGEAEGWRWESRGAEGFEIIADNEAAPAQGTRVILSLKDDALDFADEARLRQIVQKYSNHLQLPIYYGEEGDNRLNSAEALWCRSKNSISEADYKQFYQATALAFDDPALTLHWHAEGTIDYRALLFVPGARPFDLFEPARDNRVKLYVKRMFISDKVAGLLPPWLRFVRGVVDSEDLPLNVSREILQNNPLLTKIKTSLISKILAELKTLSKTKPEAYLSVWQNFGAVLKEGLYEDHSQRELLLPLLRCHSSQSDTPVSLADYVSRMPPEQTQIYYLTGEDMAQMQQNPQLEGFKARNIEVLLLTDSVDDFWPQTLGTYEGKAFASITRGTPDLEKIKAKDKTDTATGSIDDLVAAAKLLLADAIKDVRESQRLTDSPVCLVADEQDMDLRLEKLLKAHGQMQTSSKRILELNPSHALVQQLQAQVKEKGAESVQEALWLLFDQASLLAGYGVQDAHAFAQRLGHVLQRSLAA